jgi:hypothetical protein
MGLPMLSGAVAGFASFTLRSAKVMLGSDATVSTAANACLILSSVEQPTP